MADETLKRVVAKLLSLVKSKYQGSITIHFAGGIPKRIKMEHSEDL